MIHNIIGNTIFFRFAFSESETSPELFGTASIWVEFCEPTGTQIRNSPFFAHEDEVLMTAFSNKYDKELKFTWLGDWF
jgi:hypothetical protein